MLAELLGGEAVVAADVLKSEMMLTAEAFLAAGYWRRSVVAKGRRFTAERVTVEAMLEEIERPSLLTAATAFQGARWLEAWHAAFGEDPAIRPLPVTVRAADGVPAALLPLVLTREAGLRVIRFADLGVSDYNAPLLGPAAPSDAAGAAALWRALRRCLPPADVVRFERMPAEIDGRVNPLTLLSGLAPAPVFGNVVETGDDFAAWRRTALKGNVRNDIARAGRRFDASPGSAFLRVRDLATARRIYEDMRAMQRRRAAEAGFDYRLDKAAYDGVYRRMLERGIGDGAVALTALTVGDETVAASFAIVDGRGCNMLRIADAGGEWRKMAVARLLFDRTMEHLHAEGCRVFDFSLGDNDYKRRLASRRLPLFERTQALSWRGLPAAGLDRARGFVRARPRLVELVRRIMRQDEAGAKGWS